MIFYRRIAVIALSLSAAAFFLLGGCDKGEIAKSNKVLARVGDKEITTTYFDSQVGNLPESVQKLSTQGQGKKVVLEALVNRELLYSAARKKNLDKDVELLKKFEELKKELIINSYLQAELSGKLKVDDREVEGFYTANPSEYKNCEEVRVSQIVVADETSARDILEKLSIRRDFGDLAANYSSDKESASRKGDVGWFTRNRLPKEVRDSVFALKPGEVSKPFKMPDGYEIYTITDKRTVSYSFDKVKEAIRTQLYNEKFGRELKTLLEGLKKGTPVKLNEALLR
jgi:foldase protein PrsA